MSTFQKCDQSVNAMALSIMQQFETHQPLIDIGVKIDYVFAYGDRDEKGKLTGDALTLHGTKANGIARKIGLKDRAMGRGDAEISLDHDWWEQHTEPEQRALLDHELHHIAVKIDNRGVCRDDLGRPIIKLRKHDVEIGWFGVIAARHGAASQERIQSKAMSDQWGQYFFPDFCGELPKRLSDSGVTITMHTGDGKTVAATGAQFEKAAKAVIAKAKKAQHDPDDVQP